jgi:Protein of unknown function (DUF2946)
LAWLALVAVLLGALLPTVAHALAGGRAGTTWAEVCTAQGVKLVPVAAAEDPGQAETPGLSLNGSMDHCPYCTLAQAFELAPPPEGLVRVHAPVRFGLPKRFFTAATTPPVWRAAQPRAPPSRG